MKPGSIKARIALEFWVITLVAAFLAMVLHRLVLPLGSFLAFALSFIFFSALALAASYLAAAYELWPFKKLAEGGSGGDDGAGGDRDWADIPIKDTPEEVAEIQGVMRALKGKMDDAVLSQKRFLADASHEIRSPLTIMKGDIEIALRRDRDAEEYRRVLKSNLEEIDRLEYLVKDLMFLARSDASEMLVNIAPMELDDVLKVVYEKLLPLSMEKGIALELDLTEGEGAVIEGDKDRLQQLFFNLVENALRYTPAGGRVKVMTKVLAGVIRVVVSDTGIGIPEGELERIFDRFYRVEKARSREAGGTGLGLCICKWIVDAHQGEISIASKEGEGTDVTVMLLGSLGN